MDLSVNRTGKDACVPKKRKKEKKSKKHKKYKKSEKDFKQDSDSVVCDSFHSSISTFEESNSSSPQESSCFSAKNNCNAASCALVCENNSSQFNSEDKVAEQSNNFYVSSKEGVLKPADNSKRFACLFLKYLLGIFVTCNCVTQNFCLFIEAKFIVFCLRFLCFVNPINALLR